jgi:hypothetical protein
MFGDVGPKNNGSNGLKFSGVATAGTNGTGTSTLVGGVLSDSYFPPNPTGIPTAGTAGRGGGGVVVLTSGFQPMISAPETAAAGVPVAAAVSKEETATAETGPSQFLLPGRPQLSTRMRSARRWVGRAAPVGSEGGSGGGSGPGATADPTKIGMGGNGGNGGSGGNGAGGNGGPSLAIYGTDSTNVTLGTNRFSLPSQGAPGGSAPPANSANIGLSGLVQNGYPVDITDSDPATLSVASASIPMGYTGTDTLIVQVSLTLPTNAPVSVQFATADNTALAGTDYVATSGALYFDEWTTAQSIRIPILGANSSTKDFFVQLSNPAGATISTTTGTETIDYDGDIIFRNGFD